MKTLFTSIALLLFAVTVSAQTAGVIIQPEFNSPNTRRGLFAEATILKGVGLYADFKVAKTTTHSQRHSYNQLNAGLSFKVNRNLKAIASTSVINKVTIDNYGLFPLSQHVLTSKGNANRVYQVGALFNAGVISVLGAYEFDNNPRVTVGIGFNFN